MIRILIIFAFSFVFVMCSSSDSVDEHLAQTESEQAGENEVGETQEPALNEFEQGMEDDPNAEVLVFSEFVLHDAYKDLAFDEQIIIAIEQISEGGIILFEEGDYAITQDLKIEKSVTLKGVGEFPLVEESSSLRDIAGAGELKTTFFVPANKSIIVFADNVRFKHLNIEGVNGNLVEFKGTVRNFETVNVRLHNANYLLSPRDAMTPALKSRYTTYSDSYNRGFFINRKNEEKEGVAIDVLEKCLFYRCEFSVQNPLIQDTRGISLDAGNNENPNIMDFDGLDIRECYFHDIGIASSKCCNFNIIDCEFYVKDLFDFPIHLEEYSAGIVIKGCTFTCDNATVQMMGVIDHSLVEDNIVIGSCFGFIQGRFAEEMDIRGNDLSQMITTNVSGKTPIAISIWDTVGSRDIRIQNNKFAAGAAVSVAATPENVSSVVFSGNQGGDFAIKSTTGYDFPLADGVLCYIRNKSTGEFLEAAGVTANVSLSTTQSDAAQWRVYRVWPNRYNVVSEKYGSYLFIEEGTDGYGSNISSIPTIPPQTQSFFAHERKPIWELTAQTGTQTGNIVSPGGCNVSCLEINNGVLSAMTDELRRTKKVVEMIRLWDLIPIEE